VAAPSRTRGATTAAPAVAPEPATDAEEAVIGADDAEPEAGTADGAEAVIGDDAEAGDASEEPTAEAEATAEASEESTDEEEDDKDGAS
jgi:hypothetical protein